MNVPRANSLPLLHVPDVFDSPPTSPNDSVSTVTTLTADVDNDSISISSSAVNRANFESKKSRRKLTTSQVHTLERLAVRDERPSLEVRRRLAEELQLYVSHIMVAVVRIGSLLCQRAASRLCLVSKQTPTDERREASRGHRHRSLAITQKRGLDKRGEATTHSTAPQGHQRRHHQRQPDC